MFKSCLVAFLFLIFATATFAQKGNGSQSLFEINMGKPYEKLESKFSEPYTFVIDNKILKVTINSKEITVSAFEKTSLAPKFNKTVSTEKDENPITVLQLKGSQLVYFYNKHDLKTHTCNLYKRSFNLKTKKWENPEGPIVSHSKERNGTNLAFDKQLEKLKFKSRKLWNYTIKQSVDSSKVLIYNRSQFRYKNNPITTIEDSYTVFDQNLKKLYDRTIEEKHDKKDGLKLIKLKNYFVSNEGIIYVVKSPLGIDFKKIKAGQTIKLPASKLLINQFNRDTNLDKSWVKQFKVELVQSCEIIENNNSIQIIGFYTSPNSDSKENGMFRLHLEKDSIKTKQWSENRFQNISSLSIKSVVFNKGGSMLFTIESSETEQRGSYNYLISGHIYTAAITNESNFNLLSITPKRQRFTMGSAQPFTNSYFSFLSGENMVYLYMDASKNINKSENDKLDTHTGIIDYLTASLTNTKNGLHKRYHVLNASQYRDKKLMNIRPIKFLQISQNTIVFEVLFPDNKQCWVRLKINESFLAPN